MLAFHRPRLLRGGLNEPDPQPWHGKNCGSDEIVLSGPMFEADRLLFRQACRRHSYVVVPTYFFSADHCHDDFDI